MLRADGANLNDDDEEEGFDDDEGGVEPVYCICRQVSYGEMIACDNERTCPYRWFHLECVGLTATPVGATQWFCPICEKKKAGK